MKQGWLLIWCLLMNQLTVRAQCSTPLYLFADTLIAFHTDSLVLDAGTALQSYNWNTGAHSRHLTVRSSGLFIIQGNLSGGGCGIDSVRVFIVHGLPFRDTAICPSHGIDLITDAGGMHAFWSTGDSGQLIHVQPDSNQYFVCKYQSGSYQESDTVFVSHRTPQPVNVSFNKPILCKGKQDTLILTATAGMKSYTWFVDSIQQAGSTTTFEVYSPSTIQVKCVDVFGCETASPMTQVKMEGWIKASFTNSLINNRGCINDTITFINHSTSEDNLQLLSVWDFGQRKDTIYKDTITFIFEAPNVWNTRLTVISPSGCRNDTTVALYLASLPLAKFVGTQIFPVLWTSYDSCLLVQYQSLSNGNFQHYSWEISNVNKVIYNNDSSSVSAFYKWPEVSKGIQVTLTVLDPNMCKSEFSHNFYFFNICHQGLAESDGINLVLIYPNPAHNQVSFTIRPGESIQTIRMMNAIGQEIPIEWNVDQNGLINMYFSASPGMYQIRTDSDKRIGVGRLIIE